MDRRQRRLPRTERRGAVRAEALEALKALEALEGSPLQRLLFFQRLQRLQSSRLDLVHSGWERLGKAASKTRNGYTLGWNYVLRRWAGQPPSMLDRLLNGLAAVATMISRQPPLPNETERATP